LVASLAWQETERSCDDGQTIVKAFEGADHPYEAVLQNIAAGTALLRTNNVVDAEKHRDQLTKDEGASEWENPDAARVSGKPAAKGLPRADAEGGSSCSSAVRRLWVLRFWLW